MVDKDDFFACSQVQFYCPAVFFGSAATCLSSFCGHAFASTGRSKYTRGLQCMEERPSHLWAMIGRLIWLVVFGTRLFCYVAEI